MGFPIDLGSALPDPAPFIFAETTVCCLRGTTCPDIDRVPGQRTFMAIVA